MLCLMPLGWESADILGNCTCCSGITAEIVLPSQCDRGLCTIAQTNCNGPTFACLSFVQQDKGITRQPTELSVATNYDEQHTVQGWSK